MKLIFVILDGLGDLPDKKIKKTPLEAAKTKNMDAIAKDGICGLLSPLGIGIVPGSDTSHLQLFGYAPEEHYPGRGPLEALGAGIDLKHGDIALRANFATVKKGIVIDRRAGRIPTKEARKLEQYCNTVIDGVKFIFKSTVEHRGVLVIRGAKINTKKWNKEAPDLDTDPHRTGERPILKNSTYLQKLIERYSMLVHKRLSSLNQQRKFQANFVLLRGAGMYKKVEGIRKRFGISAACVAGGALYKGVARYIGMNTPEVKGATGDKNTDLKAKMNEVIKELKSNDMVVLHIKATDSFGHDGNFEGKKRMIEKIDKEVFSEILRLKNVSVIVTGDHSTPCPLKGHSGHPVPIAIREVGGRKDKVKTFGETACGEGALGNINGKDIMPIILNILRKAKKYGS